MTTTVEVMTGTRSVLHYLTKPITKTLSESLGER
jgi:adhesin transport system membrane fusion protein